MKKPTALILSLLFLLTLLAACGSTEQTPHSATEPTRADPSFYTISYETGGQTSEPSTGKATKKPSFSPSAESETTAPTDTPPETDGRLSYRRYNDGCSIKAIAPIEGELHIPESYNGLLVRGIDERAFQNQPELTAVYMPDTITYVGNEAFAECPKLRTIELSKNIKSFDLRSIRLFKSAEPIGQAVNNTALKTLVVPEGVESFQVNIAGLMGLQRIVLPSTIKSFNCSLGEYTSKSCVIDVADLEAYCRASGMLSCGEDGSFSLCVGGEQVTDLVLPEGLETINMDSAFLNMPLRSVVFPSTLKVIPSRAFKGTRLTSVTLPEGLVRVNQYAFADSKLESVVFPESLAFIENNAFENTALTSVDLPALTAIGDYAFAGTKLTSVTLHEGLKRLGVNVFPETLKSLTLPLSITQFSPCDTAPALEELIYPGTRGQLEQVQLIGWDFYGVRVIGHDELPEYLIITGE